MKVNNVVGRFSRSSSTRAPSKKNSVLPKSSYSTPNTCSSPRSPTFHADQKSPNYQRSPKISKMGINSPKVSLSSPSQTEKIFNFAETDFRPNKSPRSPRSPKKFNYDDGPRDTPGSSDSNGYYFNLASPPKKSGVSNRQMYQSSKSDSMNSTKSSLEYSSTTQHPTGAYQDIQYKVCHSLDSDTQSQTTSSYRHSSTSLSSRHSSIKEKRKPRCNIRTNPGYDDRYSSCKSINEYEGSNKTLKRFDCRKSTSDLTDMTDDVAHTMTTSLSRPSSPRRKGSVKGLAYLASRRSSRDSIASNMSNVSYEDIGPLNFQNTVRGRQRRTSNFLELPVPDHIRPRVCSLPEKPYNPRLNDDLYRLRTFSITNKGGVVNCGDSIINRRSRSNTSVNSTASRASNVSGERSPFEGSCCGSGYHTVDSTPLGSPEEVEVPKYRVVMLGDAGVGKTALVSQFMTSEYMNTYDASLDDEFGERTVSVLLDGEESEMIFIDHPSSEMSVENSLSTYEPHACVMIYSVVSRSSFQHAEETLNYLWREGYTQEKSVIVVGNKADLARARVISPNEGKSLAVARDCKFIETSSGIQHNVDELLVGILKQIRLRESREKKKATLKKDNHKIHGSKTSLSLNIAREILQKICLNDISKSKSCENLHVL
ncbi:uncharacterized protein LOC130446550 [Diorhabda sublineata]|uniref:uncharacterized protein LOC130446550 n=1 Tax=Diorhabda sublineata TaxID=1163346 RepID=UPI0024E129D2|nr:uncharacterized protein LOC130446550 [Diorhabda sublineata]